MMDDGRWGDGGMAGSRLVVLAVVSTRLKLTWEWRLALPIVALSCLAFLLLRCRDVRPKCLS